MQWLLKLVSSADVGGCDLVDSSMDYIALDASVDMVVLMRMLVND